MNTNEIVHQIRLQLWDITYTRYLNQELFSYQWWGLIVLLLITYSIWWRLVDKTRLMEILLFGSYVTVIASIIDIWGVTTAHWQYNIRIFPILPAPFPFDYTLVPILLMVSHQYGKNWGSYLGWSTLSSGLFSFGIIPVFQATGIKSYYSWNFIYFFILTMGIAVTARYAIHLTIRIVEASRAERQSISSYSSLFQPATKPLRNEVNSSEKKPQRE